MRGGGEKGKGRPARKASHLEVAADPLLVIAGLVPRLSGSARPVVKFSSLTTLRRRARACPGHPRRAEATNFESLMQPLGVDGRDKPGQDAERTFSL